MIDADKEIRKIENNTYSSHYRLMRELVCQVARERDKIFQLCVKYEKDFCFETTGVDLDDVKARNIVMGQLEAKP